MKQLRLFTLIALIVPVSGYSQCTNANVNWDNLEYFITNGNTNYTTYINTPAYFTNMVQTQRFAIGVNRVTIGTNFTATQILGENTSHTGESGSFGAGADIQYSGNGTITLTFDAEVTNVRFSLYDVDQGCRTQLSAQNASGTNLNVTLTAAAGLWTNSRFTPNPATSTTTSVGTNPRVDANGTSSNNSSTNATLNVSVAGPVKTITIVVSNNSTDPSFWLSDIQACVTGSFPNNYYAISQPYTGQPSWVLAVHDLNTIFMVDPATGRAVSLFTDTDPRVREINTISYDPYKRIIYYSIDGLERCTPAGSPDSIRQIKKYDVNTGTISNVISNVNQTPFNIPTFQYGLESAGAAFYNGSLFVGVEGYKLNTDTKNSGRKTVIWRVDFASDSITPTQACQVWAIPVDNGTNNVHDWADFVIKDGVLYNSNSSVNAVGGSGNGLYYHVNMQTNTVTTTVNPNTSANKPAQSAQTWDGRIYWVSNEIGLYNGTTSNTVTGKQTIANAARSVTWVGPAGDAGEAFKPKADFGDAPSSYDPVASSPAIHERDTALRIGTYGWEWTKNTSSLANGDPDEDGVATVPMLSQSGTGYLVPVSVWNNTGANATLIGWLDYNDNGVFDASEASAVVTVTSMAAAQSVNLTWSSTPNSFTLGDHTFLRIRLTAAANGMTASNPTGYFRDGEVEDYRVTIGEYPLDVKLLSFNVKGYNNKTALLSWTTTSEDGFEGFEVERSADGIQWTTAGKINAKGQNRSSVNDYVFTDMNPFRGKTYYRLKLLDANGQTQYSEIRTVAFKNFVEEFRISPNPTREQTTITVEANSSFMATLTISDFMGRSVYTTNLRINAGSNKIPVSGLGNFNNGIYMVQLISDEINISGKLMITK